MIKKILIITSFLFLAGYWLYIAPVWGREIPADNPSLSLKTQILDFTEYNQQLTDQHQKLEQEFAELEKEVYEKGIDLSEPKEVKKDNEKSLETIKSEIEAQENQILLAQSKVAYWKSQLIGLEKKKLSLELSKKNLEDVPMEIDKNASEDKSLGRKGNSNSEENDYEQALVHRIEELEENITVFSRTLKDLQAEQKALEKETVYWEKKVELKTTENEFLQNKMKLTMLKENGPLVFKNDEYEDLKQKEDRLERELARSDQGVDQSPDVKKTHQELMVELINLDKKNQELRDRVARFEKGLSGYNN